MARQRSGTQFDPQLWSSCSAPAPTSSSPSSESVTSWDAVMAAEPALDRELAERRARGRAWRRSPTSSTSSRRTRSGTRGRSLSSPARRPVTWAARARRRRPCGAPRWCTTSVGSVCPNAIWDKPGPLTRAEVERVRLHPYLTERMLVSVAGAGVARRRRRPAPRAPRRLGLPAGAGRRRASAPAGGSWPPPTSTGPRSSRARIARRWRPPRRPPRPASRGPRRTARRRRRRRRAARRRPPRASHAGSGRRG